MTSYTMLRYKLVLSDLSKKQKNLFCPKHYPYQLQLASWLDGKMLQNFFYEELTILVWNPTPIQMRLEPAPLGPKFLRTFIFFLAHLCQGAWICFLAPPAPPESNNFQLFIRKKKIPSNLKYEIKMKEQTNWKISSSISNVLASGMECLAVHATKICI